MLSFLRTSVITVALGCLLLISSTTPAVADSRSDLERQKNGVSQELDGARRDFNESSKQLSESANALKTAQGSLERAQTSLEATSGQLVVARAQDVQMQAKLSKSEAALEDSITKLDEGTKSAASAEAQVREYTLQTLQDGDSGMRAFSDLFRGASPASFTEQMTLNRSVSDAQLATMQRLDASRVVLKLKRDKVRDLRDEVAAARRESAANLALKKTLEDRAREQTAQVGQLVADRADAKATAEKTLAEDTKQLQEFEADRARLSQRLRELAAAELAKSRRQNPQRQAPPHQSSPKQAAPDKTSSGGAPARRGGGSSTLLRPVGGPVTSPYGMRVHPVTGVYKLHDGTDLGASCGTPIKAAANGTVAERYFNGAYGNRLIVNHGVIRGANVVTTYNHAASYIVSAGQRVSRGQTIGYVGSTGYSTGCHLHFMVLTNGNTVNPMNWVG